MAHLAFRLEVMDCVNAWVALISAYVGSATVIYNVVIAKVLDALEVSELISGK